VPSKFQKRVAKATKAIAITPKTGCSDSQIMRSDKRAIGVLIILSLQLPMYCSHLKTLNI
jgi:hypothetical protein